MHLTFLDGVSETAQAFLLCLGLLVGAGSASLLWWQKLVLAQYKTDLANRLLDLEKKFRAQDQERYDRDRKFQEDTVIRALEREQALVD